MTRTTFKIVRFMLVMLLGILPLSANASEKVLIVVTSHGFIGEDAASSKKDTGYFLSEVTHPYYELKAAGFEIDIASPQGGLPPMDPGSYKLSDDDNNRFMKTPEDWQKMETTLRLKDIQSKDYAAILFAGGHGTMWDFPDNADIHRLAKEIYENNGIVAAVCHGPAALVNVTLSNGDYLVANRQISTFTNLEERIVRLYSDMPFLLETRLEQRGANINKTWIPFRNKVSVDERLVTGQNPNSARTMGIEVVQLLQQR